MHMRARAFTDTRTHTPENAESFVQLLSEPSLRIGLCLNMVHHVASELSVDDARMQRVCCHTRASRKSQKSVPLYM